MNKVQVVLPSKYDNAWLLRLINVFDEADIEVEFVNLLTRPYYVPQPYTPNWPVPYITSGSGQLKTNDQSYTINTTSNVVSLEPKLKEAKTQEDINEQIRRYTRMIKNQNQFNQHKKFESSAQADVEDKYRPWYEGESYGPDK